MIESHLSEGRQDIVPGMPLQHGMSVTDGCTVAAADPASLTTA